MARCSPSRHRWAFAHIRACRQSAACRVPGAVDMSNQRMSGAACINGLAAGLFKCKNVNLLAAVSLPELRGRAEYTSQV
eukprot:4283973-Pyramimonas_sp.AAC.1